MKKEIWKEVKGYEGKYQVSNFGGIKSLKRSYVLRDRIIKPILKKCGYFKVNLRKENEVRHISVHQLVAIAFLNHKPCGYKIVVDHIDNNPLNNNVDNLQLISQRENASKDRKGGTSKYVGVCWDKNNNKWMSSIYINNKSKYLGRFENEYDAYLAYKAEIKNLKII